MLKNVLRQRHVKGKLFCDEKDSFPTDISIIKHNKKDQFLGFDLSLSRTIHIEIKEIHRIR